MSDKTTHFHGLLQALKAGSQDAARELVEQYGSHVLRCIRQRLPRRIRPQYDSIDFAQLVWKSVFTGRDILSGLDSPRRFEGMLWGMVRNKISDVERELDTRKRDVQKQVPLDDDEAKTHPSNKDPTPSAVAVFRDEWSQLAEEQPARSMQVVQLRYEGNTWEEIAAKLDIDESTARKVINRLRKQKLAEAAEEQPVAALSRMPPLPRTA
jgi:RNA polymerase sigma factor (sigma-70 family)